VQHAVAVEVNLSAVRRPDETVALVGKELAHLAVRRDFVGLDGARWRRT
jgi:hypothetical protein